MSPPNDQSTTAMPQLRRWLSILLSSFLLLTISSCVSEDDLTADQRVYQLSQQLMCPVCDAQTLDQSQAQLSEDMKAVIRRKIEEGDSNAEIRAYFVERYGEVVLASPDAGGFNLIAWIVPIVIFVGGALLVGSAYINMRRQRRVNAEGDGSSRISAQETEQIEDVSDDEYLKRADREIASALNQAISSTRSESQSGDG